MRRTQDGRRTRGSWLMRLLRHNSCVAWRILHESRGRNAPSSWQLRCWGVSPISRLPVHMDPMGRRLDVPQVRMAGSCIGRRLFAKLVEHAERRADGD